MTSASDFVGAWQLIDWTVTMPGQPERRPYGDNPNGRIIYSSDGAMSATFMAQDRRALDTLRPALPAKIAEAVKGVKAGELPKLAQGLFFSAITFTGYCGTYSVTADKVIHHVETALIHDWVGTDLVRGFEFVDDRLILTANEDQVVDRLVWRRR